MTLLGQGEIPYLKLQHQLCSSLIAGNGDWRSVPARRRNPARFRNVDIHPQRLALLFCGNIVQRIGYVERHHVRVRVEVAAPTKTREQAIGIPTRTERVTLLRRILDMHVPFPNPAKES